ncbi:hypothetical protein BJ875DRAFT_528614 [Amylocarpus encephaloides]|uniref:Protein kinase domain-containing protein n=1 Tax=Amylocarpus encephaloides TaxID=45428 RepID=A0A9P7Y6H4_9HELO|nr:hypothetical protein BJ875DRAFT_528614 [Amylocarpus encephaloides]
MRGLTLTTVAQEAEDSSGRKQVAWLLWKKKRMNGLVEEYEKWNERLFAIVQLHMLAKATFAITEVSAPANKTLGAMKKDINVRILGLDDEMILTQMASCESLEWKHLEVRHHGINLDGEAQKLPCGTYDGHDVVVDFKSFVPKLRGEKEEPGQNPQESVMNRIRQLATLLNHSRSSRFRLLPCHGFFQDLEIPRFGFIFETPPGRHRKPLSLYQFLSSTSGSRNLAQKPALDHRLPLALILAIALGQFHSVSWVHKSMRSENIVFFLADIQDRDWRLWLQDPWIMGFEYAREDPGLSEDNRIIDARQEIYRHPEQWGQPTRRFHKIHDIYSLGVVMLEIGLWKPAEDLEKDGFRLVRPAESTDVKRMFEKQARDKLPFLTGHLYASVVVKCLTGNILDNESGEKPTFEEAYHSSIVEALRACRLHCNY